MCPIACLCTWSACTGASLRLPRAAWLTARILGISVLPVLFFVWSPVVFTLHTRASDPETHDFTCAMCCSTGTRPDTYTPCPSQYRHSVRDMKVTACHLVYKSIETEALCSITDEVILVRFVCLALCVHLGKVAWGLQVSVPKSLPCSQPPLAFSAYIAIRMIKCEVEGSHHHPGIAKERHLCSLHPCFLPVRNVFISFNIHLVQQVLDSRLIPLPSNHRASYS